MDTYELAELGERQGSVWLSCTHGQEAQEILAEIRRRFPGFRTRPRQEYTSGAGDETGWLIDKCGGRHRYALWWLIGQLCARSWEPFAVAHDPSREAYVAPLYLFRKRVEQRTASLGE